MTFWFLLLQAAPAAVGGTPLPQDDPPETVVVIGRAARDPAAALADCIARHCPSKQDIALSLAQAQAQFAAGDYLASRKTLLAARRRNQGHAAELPLDVAGLNRAASRMASLNGLKSEAHVRVFDIVDSLKAGLDKNDEQVMLARIEVGAEFARSGRMRAAIDQYTSVAKAARKANFVTVEGLALFQRASLLTAAATVAPANYASQARRAIAEFNGRSEPSWLPFRNALRIVPALLAPEDRRPALIDEAVRTMEPQPTSEPQLLYSPAIDLAGDGSLSGEITEWLDLDYRIAADGMVHDVHVQRRSGRVRESWVQAASQALSARRYAPMLLSPGQPEARKTERISFVSDTIGAETGSRMTGRAAERRADAQDLRKGIDSR